MSEYLLDSNTVIYYLDEVQLLPQAALHLIDGIVDGDYQLSVVTKIEVVGKRNVEVKEERMLRSFCSDAEIIELEQDIVERSIKLRQRYKLKFGDAIIAATALEHNMKLITRNTKDFVQIEGLTIINPWELDKA